MNPRIREPSSRRIGVALLGFASCAAVLVPTPHLMRSLGSVVVLAAPLLAVGLLATRRVARGRTLRALLFGASVGLVLIFAYGFSPPVLERIGHAMGWPGQSLRVWEKFTAPVYDYCCRDPWFWQIFVVWDTWTAMLVAQPIGSAARFMVGCVPLLAGFAAGLVYLRHLRHCRTHSPGDT
jgi:hypothetical protein